MGKGSSEHKIWNSHLHLHENNGLLLREDRNILLPVPGEGFENPKENIMARIGNKNRSLQISGILCAAFVLLLLLVKIIDVRHIGPNYTKVGFAALNGLFYKIGYHPFWYKLTQFLGILALVVALAFALLGVYQLIKRKSIGAVDADIVLLGVVYVITILLYLFFNAVVVNYRPVLLEETMEASFPSSHTVLAIVVFATAIIQVRRRLPEGQTKQIVIYVFYALLVILVVGRILSGVHWFTDICGGVLLGFALTYLYQGLLESFEGSSGKHAK